MPTYVLRCQSGKEEHLIQVLGALRRMDAFRLWTPKRSVYHRNNEREKQRRGEALTLLRQPLFAGYMFADAEDFPSLHEALVFVRMDSWFYLLGKQSESKRMVTEKELEWIGKLTAEEPSRGYRVGDRVRFTDDSPLSGFEGNIVKVDWRQSNVCVSVPFDGEKTVWVGVDMISQD